MNRLVTVNLTEDAESVKTVIGNQVASGGGDGPEDVTGGLKACKEMDWKAGAKVVVLVGDSPCPFKKYNNGGDDASNLAAALALYGRDDYIELVALSSKLSLRIHAK
jgi:hypothetical protein